MDVIGMLYIVNIRMIKRSTNEKVRQQILMVGCEKRDISRKLKWIIDGSRYDELSITKIEKIRQKVHLLSTVITQHNETVGPVVQQGDSSKVIRQHPSRGNDYKPRMFSIGVTTTMVGRDEDHVLRKAGRAMIAAVSDIKSFNGPLLSDDSTVMIEEIPFKNRMAKARDVSNEVNKATFVRG